MLYLNDLKGKNHTLGIYFHGNGIYFHDIKVFTFMKTRSF